MKRYPIRAAKYILYFVILFMILFGFLQLVGYTSLSMESLVTSYRGLMLVGVILVFSLLYPFFGFTKRRLTFDAAKRAEDVTNIMAMCGFKRIPSEDDPENKHMIFEAASTGKRVAMMFEDKIEITTDADGASYIEGHRKEVVRAYFRMGTYIA